MSVHQESRVSVKLFDFNFAQPLIDLAQLNYPPLLGVLTTAIGGMGGWQRGRYVRRHAEWYLKRMTKEVDELMEWMRVELFEKSLIGRKA